MFGVFSAFYGIGSDREEKGSTKLLSLSLYNMGYLVTCRGRGRGFEENGWEGREKVCKMITIQHNGIGTVAGTGDKIMIFRV